MSSIFRYKKTWSLVSLIVVSTAAFLIVGSYKNIDKSDVSSQSNSPKYQTGKAFEGDLSGNTAASDLSGKSAEQLVSDADAIILATDKLIDKSKIPSIAMTSEQKQQIDKTVLELEQQIKELEGQLK